MFFVQNFMPNNCSGVEAESRMKSKDSIRYKYLKFVLK